MSDPLLDASATRLAALIAAKAVSPVEVLEAHLARIEAANPSLNALVVPRFAQARREAQAAERALSNPKTATLGPLHGVPCTVKEFLGLAGAPNTGGIVAHRARTAPADATVVARLKRAGAIIMGQTNVPEGGLWMAADSKVYGRTNNPWDLKRTPGGSSGGEGAIIGVGGSPIGLGTDIGGSIRIPAAFCGVVGHKPTGALVPTTGHFPQSEPSLRSTLATGPMARRVEDLTLLTNLIAGPDGHCPAATKRHPPIDPASVTLQDLTVYVLDTGPKPRLRPIMKQAVAQAAEALVKRGARLKVLPLRGLSHGIDIWAARLAEASGDTHYDDILSPDRPFSVWRELLRHAFFRPSRHTFPALVMCAAESFVRHFPKRTRKMLALGQRLQATLQDALKGPAIFLYPPYTRPAPRHWTPLLTPFDAACTTLFSVMEVPATVVPITWHKGLPVAVQVGAGRFKDALCLAAAAALEEDFGGWRRAPILP